jgi:hypothetical protein
MGSKQVRKVQANDPMWEALESAWRYYIPEGYRRHLARDPAIVAFASWTDRSSIPVAVHEAVTNLWISIMRREVEPLDGLSERDYERRQIPPEQHWQHFVSSWIIRRAEKEWSDVISVCRDAIAKLDGRFCGDAAIDSRHMLNALRAGHQSWEFWELLQTLPADSLELKESAGSLAEVFMSHVGKASYQEYCRVAAPRFRVQLELPLTGPDFRYVEYGDDSRRGYKPGSFLHLVHAAASAISEAYGWAIEVSAPFLFREPGSWWYPVVKQIEITYRIEDDLPIASRIVLSISPTMDPDDVREEYMKARSQVLSPRCKGRDTGRFQPPGQKALQLAAFVLKRGHWPEGYVDGAKPKPYDDLPEDVRARWGELCKTWNEEMAPLMEAHPYKLKGARYSKVSRFRADALSVVAATVYRKMRDPSELNNYE